MFLQEIMDPDTILVEGDGLSKQYVPQLFIASHPRLVSY